MYKDIKVFEEYPGVSAGCTTRDCEAKSRRAEMAAEAASRGAGLAALGIVHSARVEVLNELSCPPGEVQWIEDCDGAISDRTGIIITATTGDCLPIFAFDPIRRAIGLAHAGWRGVLSGIPSALIEKMVSSYGCEPEDIVCHIGPGIGLCCFEVSEDVAEAFFERYPWSEDYSIELGKGKYKLDLKGISLELLELCGVRDATASPHCTCCEPELFYSYRRSKDSLRMLQYIELK